MKFDKESIIVAVVCLAVLFAWNPICRKMGWIPEPQSVEQTQNAVPEENVTVPAVLPEKKTVKTIPVADEKIEVKNTSEKVISLESPTIKLNFGKDGSYVNEIVMKEFLNNQKTAPIFIKNDSNLERGMLNAAFDGVAVKKNVFEWQMDDGRNCRSLNTVYTDDGRVFQVAKTYTLASEYVINLQLTITNSGKKELKFKSLNISGGDIQGWSELSGDKIRNDSLLLSYYPDNDKVKSVKADAKEFELGDVRAAWSSVSNKFFALILKSDRQFTPIPLRSEVSDDVYVIGFNAAYNGLTVAPGASEVINLSFYAGPKEPKLLTDFSPECGELLHLAWGPINYLAKWMLWLLVKLHGLCGSYGWSIIILTLLVRLIFYPVTQKANTSMKKMQIVQPQIKALRDKYKANPQLLNTKMMELYQKEKINPLGGCLPILLQIPVFFALYATLDGALELRQIPFLWSPDLAGPDTVWSFPLGFSLFGVSHFNLNPLAIIMTALMVVQQRITPSAMEPAQQKMMALMPVIMLIFFYELPSGLTLYWTVSQIFSILQVFIQRKFEKQAEKA